VEPACLYLVLVGLCTLVEHWLWRRVWQTALVTSLGLAAVLVLVNYRAEIRQVWRTAGRQRS
jgi:hypothetical protein